MTYWRVPRPAWLHWYPNDELSTLFGNIDNLRRDGRVVWGYIIQANSLLFTAGSDDLPAEVVYALDVSNPIAPDKLSAVAQALGSLKHTRPADPDLASIADYLTNELTRVFGRPVPSNLSPGHKCQISTIYVIRNHLPKPQQCLQQPLLPIIVHPNPPHVALVLPSRYWPHELMAWWRHGGSESARHRSGTTPSYRAWLLKLIAWDGGVPALVLVVPEFVEMLFPNRRGVVQMMAIALPIAAFLVRFFIARRQINSNQCSRLVRRVQMAALCIGIFILLMIDALLILARDLPKGALFATTTDVVTFIVLIGMYLICMVIATYPGRAETASEL